ncbi:MAG: sarcosine oxidase subunit gamma [Hyphomicrobiaceae bacterium]
MADTLFPETHASPFAGRALPSVPGVATISLAAPLARLVLRAGPAAAARIGSSAGLDLRSAINTARPGDGATALRLGPDEWLLLAEPDGDPWLAARIGDAAADAGHGLVDVTHRNIGLVLEGPEVETLLSAGCALPLDIASFPPGRATRTLLAKAEAVLWRRAADRFHLEVARSFAPYLVAFLAEAMAAEAAIRTVQRS